MRILSTTELSSLLPTERTSAPTETSATTGTGEASFAGILMDTVQEANASDHVASSKAAALASGLSDDIHGTMISAKEAEISMKLVGSIRSKLLDAFHEIWRTSV